MTSDDQLWTNYDPVMTSYDRLLQVVGSSYHQYDQLEDPFKKMVTFRDYSASCIFLCLSKEIYFLNEI